jgi:hypothetical protein
MYLENLNRTKNPTLIFALKKRHVHAARFYLNRTKNPTPIFARKKAACARRLLLFK